MNMRTCSKNRFPLNSSLPEPIPCCTFCQAFIYRAGVGGCRRKGVAQVVDTDIFDPCAGADTLPEGLQVAEWLARQRARLVSRTLNFGVTIRPDAVPNFFACSRCAGLTVRQVMRSDLRVRAGLSTSRRPRRKAKTQEIAVRRSGSGRHRRAMLHRALRWRLDCTDRRSCSRPLRPR